MGLYIKDDFDSLNFCQTMIPEIKTIINFSKIICDEYVAEKYLKKNCHEEVIIVENLLKYNTLEVVEFCLENLNKKIYYNMNSLLMSVFNNSLENSLARKKIMNIMNSLLDEKVLWFNVNAPNTEDFQVNIVGERRRVTEFDNTFQEVYTEKNISRFFQKERGNFFYSLLEAKILHFSFFLEELVDYGDILSPFPLKNLFFENFEDFEKFSDDFNIKTSIKEKKKDNFIDTFLNIFQENQNLELPIPKIKQHNIFYGNCIFNKEDINCSKVYTPFLDSKKSEPFKREIELGDIESFLDPYMFYMREILGLKQKSMNQIVLSKIKDNLTNSLKGKTPFKNNFYIEIDEEWINSQPIELMNNNLIYNGQKLCLCFSEYDIEAAKRIARRNKLKYLAICNLSKKEIKVIKILGRIKKFTKLEY